MELVREGRVSLMFLDARVLCSRRLGLRLEGWVWVMGFGEGESVKGKGREGKGEGRLTKLKRAVQLHCYFQN